MKKLLTSLFGSVSAVALFLGTFAMVSNNAFASQANAFDYSKDSNSTTLSSADLVEKITGENISEIERNYLNTNQTSYSLTYQNNQSSINNLEVVEYYNNLHVTVTPYSYVDKNGRTLTWNPVSASFRGVNKPVIDNKCTFDNYNGLTKEVSVNYELQITLPKNEVNSLLNSAYEYAYPSYQKVIENLEMQEEYQTAVENYQSYLAAVDQYYIDKANYEQYLIDKNDYDIKLEDYNAYLEAYAKYEQELATYNQYLADLAAYNAQVEAYAKYLNDLKYYNDNYEANQALYEAYQSTKDKIDYRLRTMQIIFDVMTDYERTIYDAVMGSSVTSVLSRKQDIVTAGVPAEAVDRASVATSELRVVFEDYSNLETDAERYEYYRLNWSHIKDNVNELARCLEKFLRYDLVFNILSTQENNRLEKYIILVAQLIYLADALNNTNVYNYEGWNSSTNTGSLTPNNSALLDANYPIRVSSNKQTKTYAQILEGTELMDISNKYGRPGPEKYDAELIDLMTEPKEVLPPGEIPTPVKEPVEPKKVQNPGAAPEVKTNPGSLPTPVENPIEPTYISTTEEEVLYGNAIIEGKIVQRNKLTSDVTITINDRKSFNFNNVLKHLVKIYDTKGEFVKEKVITNGISINNNEITNYLFDKIYDSYSFIYKDRDGNQVDLNTLNKSVDLYAELVAGPLKEYTITFDVDGNKTIQKLHYGDVVTPPSNPTKEETEDCYYSFIGWDKAIKLVIGNETYAALFKTHHYTFVNKIVNGVTTNYKFNEDDLDLIFDIPSKDDSGDKYYEFDHWDITSTDQYHLVYTAIFNEYDYIYINWYIDETTYILNDKYKQNEIVEYPYSTPTKEGDSNYVCYVLDYWMDSEGNQIDLSSISASISLYAHFIGSDSELHTVYFYLDGEIIYSNNYSTGSMPNIPTVSKEGTEDYYYYFLGWDKPVTPVSENTSYYAQFELRYYIHVTIVVEGYSTYQKVKTLDELILNNPTKPASNGYSYLFKEWKVVKIDNTHYTYTAVFDSYFSITFVIEGEINEESFKLGETISLDTPSKEGNEIYYYSFVGWANADGEIINLSSINSSITLYAQFEEHYVIYLVTWVLGNETIVNEYHYGDTLTIPTDLSKEDTDRYYYTFDRWDKVIINTVTSNVTYTAIYNEHNYTIIRTNVDGEITTYKFKEGESISLPTPEKENDNHHDYVFAGWEITNVENAYTFIYTAKFNITTYCYLTWVVEGKVVGVEKYLLGSLVSYKGQEPKKDEGEKVYYTFIGWGADLASFRINVDTTLTAQFKTNSKIAVIWMVNDESYIEYYKPGEALALPNITVKPYYNDLYYFSFLKWDKPLEDKVNTTLIYTAIFQKNALFTSGNNDELRVSIIDGYYLVNLDLNKSKTYDFEYFLKMESEIDKVIPLKLVANNLTIIIESNRINYLINNKIHSFKLIHEVDSQNTHKLAITFDCDKEVSSFNLKAEVSGIFDSERTFVYNNNKKVEADVSDEKIWINNFENGIEYEIVTTYNVSFEYSVNYVGNILTSSFKYNDVVEIEVTPEKGYKILSIYYEENGNCVLIENNKFVLPMHDVLIKVDLEQIVYTITFVVDGKIVATYQAHYGDIVVDPSILNPEILEKENDENYRYVFISWDKEIGPVTGDTVYEAVFEAIGLVHNTITQRRSIITLLGIGGGIYLLAGIGIGIFIYIKRKK